MRGCLGAAFTILVVLPLAIVSLGTAALMLWYGTQELGLLGFAAGLVGISLGVLTTLSLRRRWQKAKRAMKPEGKHAKKVE